MGRYILDSRQRAAEMLALEMVQHEIDNPYREFVVEGKRVGAEYDEVITITYKRERKPPTLTRRDTEDWDMSIKPERD